MININNANFSFRTTIKLSDLPLLNANVAFPGVADISIDSRNFLTYIECVDGAKVLLNGIAKDINKSKGVKYTISAEVNPAFGGADGGSEDWEDYELCRLWLFNKKDKGHGKISAAGQSRIYAVEPTLFAELLN